MTPLAKEIFGDVTLVNMWTNRNPWKISRTGIYGYNPISTPIYSVMRKSPTPSYIDSIGTRITIVNSDTTTAQPCGLNMISKIGNIRQSATPDLRDYDKLDTSIDGKFTNNLDAPPISTDVLSEKISNSSI